MTRGETRFPSIRVLAAAVVCLLAQHVAAQDAATVKGTWTVGGQTRSITVEEFEGTQKILAALEGTAQRGVTPERVWEYILTNSEADAYGIVVTDDELANKLQKNDEDIFNGIVRRWELQKVTAEQGEEYTRRLLAFDKLRNFLLNTQRITTRQAFDQFKQNHLQFKLDYVVFAAEQYEDQVGANELDDEALRAYWNENRQVSATFREPAQVSVEYVHVDPARYDVDKARTAAGTKAVGREEALAYFRANRKKLMAQIPPDKKHLLEFGPDTPIEQVKTPFEVLRETIETQLLLDGVLEQARAEAQRGTALKAVSEQFGLSYSEVSDIDRARATTQLRSFGFNAFAQLFAKDVGELSGVEASPTGERYFFKLRSKKDSRLPEFDEVAKQVREQFVTTKSAEIAKREAQRVIQIMNDKAELDIEEERAALEPRAVERAEKRIAELGLSRPADRNREITRARAEIRREVEQLKKKKLPKHFEDYLAESGRKVESTDYFEFQPVRLDRTRDADAVDSRKRFLESNYYVRSLEIGDVAPILIEDHVTKAYFIIRLADKRDPDMSTMGPVDLHQARAQLAQIREMEFTRRWRYPILRDRLKLKESK